MIHESCLSGKGIYTVTDSGILVHKRPSPREEYIDFSQLCYSPTCDQEQRITFNISKCGPTPILH